MKKRAAVGDIHLSGFESDLLDDLNLPIRLGLIMKTLEFIISECRKRHIIDIDILGDLINDKSIIYTVAQNQFSEFLIRHADINFTIISGNHDNSSVGENQKSAISVFDAYPNVQCIPYRPLVIGNITYIPHTKNFMDEIIDCEPTDILISHLGLNEAHLASGLSGVDKITMNDISKKFKLALLGHYHSPQYLKNDNVRIYYAGSIYHRDWGDKNEHKMFLIYDTETLEVEQIPITGFREFKEYTIETIEQKADILQKAEIARNKGHLVRIKNKSGVKLKDEVSDGVLVVETVEIDITNRGIEITQTREEQLKKYMEIKEIPEENRVEYLDFLAKYDILTKGVTE